MGLKAVANMFAHPPAGYRFADAEVPTGTVNGSTTAFTLAQTPNPAASLVLVLNGITQTAGGTDYTLATNTITYVAAPPTGSIHEAWYRY